MADAGESRFVDVVYALPNTQAVVRIEHCAGMTALDAVERSGLLEKFPQIDLQHVVLGVYGVGVAHEHVLAPSDRVEICRPLSADPRELRRELAQRGEVIGGGEKTQS